TRENSGSSSCVRPPGFHEAAVASSAMAMKALPMPMARAPLPTGFGDDEISISCAAATWAATANPRRRATAKLPCKRVHVFRNGLPFLDNHDLPARGARGDLSDACARHE